VVAALQLFIFTFILKFDTPKYYLINNQENEAKEVIKAIYTSDYVEQTFAREKIAEKPVELFNMISKYQYQLLLCAFLYFMVQYTGSGMMGYYSTFIFLGMKGDVVENTAEFLFEVRMLNLFLALIQFCLVWFNFLAKTMLCIIDTG